MQLNINRQGQGPALVFFHGFAFDHRVWLDCAAILKKNYTLYLVDLPGFGLTSLMDWFDFKCLLLNRLPDKSTVLGWSMGGLFATRLALEAPERVSKLINIASTPRFIKEKEWPGISPLNFRLFLKNIIANPRQTLTEFVKLQLNDNNYDFTHLLSFETKNLESNLGILADLDLRDSLPGLTMPTTYLFGRLDALTPRATMGVMQKRYPFINTILFPKAAHMPFLSHQSDFITVLERILK